VPGPGPDGLTDVVVGRVGRPHGVRGEVSVEVRTDEPSLRFVVGAVLRPSSGRSRALTVHTVRAHGDRLLVTFAEVRDRSAAEALRGAVLVADVESGLRPDDPEEFYDRQLIGMQVRMAQPAPAAGDGPGGDAVRTDAAGTGALDAYLIDMDAADPRVGPPVGTVVDLRHLPAQDLLEIRLEGAGSGTDRDSPPDATADTVLVPFVRALVPVVDLEAGWLAVSAVPGLLDPEPPAEDSHADPGQE